MTSSTRPHGYARYKLDGCRCYVCGFARSEYDTRREQAIRDGHWQPFTIAGPARRHVEQLNALGYGDRSIAALAGVGRKLIQDVRRGVRSDPTRNNPPLTKIRTTSAAAILAVPLTTDELPDRALVDAAPTWALIDDLIGRGWTKAKIAREAGLGRAIQLGRDTVTARNARRVEALHERATRWGLDIDEFERLVDTDTPESLARRFGYRSTNGLEQALYRASRFDLVGRMNRHAA